MSADPLLTNATIAVTRAGTPIGPASIPVMIAEPKPWQLDDRGGVRLRDIYLNIATDIQAQDEVTLLTFNQRPARNPGPYEVQDAQQKGGLGLELLCVHLIGFTI